MRWRRPGKDAGDHGGADGGDGPADDRSPGWDAIDAAAGRLYGQAVPRHVGYQPPAAFSTNLQGCSAYAAAGHWHYLSYGLSELYVPPADADPAVSGWGFEFTLRLSRGTETEPPGWPFTMINELAKHVNGNQAPILPGDRVDLRTAITGHPSLPDAPPTGLTVFAFTVDPELGQIQTPNGAVIFLQAVGVTAAEKERMLATSTADVLGELASTNPLLITDPSRA